MDKITRKLLHLHQDGESTFRDVSGAALEGENKIKVRKKKKLDWKTGMLTMTSRWTFSFNAPTNNIDKLPQHPRRNKTGKIYK